MFQTTNQMVILKYKVMISSHQHFRVTYFQKTKKNHAQPKTTGGQWLVQEMVGIYIYVYK